MVKATPTTGRLICSGALLALFGMGILVADIRNMKTAAGGSHPAWQRKSTQHGTALDKAHRSLELFS